MTVSSARALGCHDGPRRSCLPQQADAYLLSHIIHNWDDERASVILANVHQAMTENSKLVVVERIIPPGNEPSYGKFADLNMLVLHGGLERTALEFERLFETARFRLKEIVPTVTEVSVIEGIRRPWLKRRRVI